MSVQYIEQRICDVCGVQYTANNQAWMTINAPNLGEEAPVFDFCQWSCLETWVNSADQGVEDEDPDDEMLAQGADLVPEPEESVIDRQKQAQAQAKLDAAMAQMAAKPQMTLAEAIMSGQLDGAMRNRGQ